MFLSSWCEWTSRAAPARFRAAQVSIQSQKQRRVRSADHVLSGEMDLWPGSREGPLVAGNGYLFSGIGQDECAHYARLDDDVGAHASGGNSDSRVKQNSSAGQEMPTPGPLSGLWRWDVKQERLVG
jgi:hypothetical protein